MSRMETGEARTDMEPLEKQVVRVGFWLAGLVIAVTAVSYLLNMTFRYQFLVWVIGIAFAAVALLALEWPRSFSGPLGEVPGGGLRQFLVLAIPLAFVLDSQICGLGLKACSVVCNVISVALIGLGALIASRLYRDQPIGALLVPMVILGLIPHCVCDAPINVIWQRLLGGYAPTCQVIPLTATLFSISALRGRRTLWSAALVVVLLVVIAFIAVGNPLFGFPWQGCV
jgi:predicted neutral ceramidase superfamily lipid hydrolase